MVGLYVVGVAAVGVHGGQRWKRTVTGEAGSACRDGRLSLGPAGTKTRETDGCPGRRMRRLGGLAMGQWDGEIAVRALEAAS